MALNGSDLKRRRHSSDLAMHLGLVRSKLEDFLQKQKKPKQTNKEAKSKSVL